MKKFFQIVLKNKSLFGSLLGVTGLFFLVAMICVVYFGSSFGWFSNNIKTTTTGMGVSTHTEDFNVKYTYFKYDIRESEVVTSASLEEIEFNQYDLVFRSRNRYTPIVVRIEMTGSSLPSAGTITAKINRDTSKAVSVDDHGTMKMSNFFTSIMRVTPYVGSALYNSNKDTQFNNIDSTTNFNAVRALKGNDATTGSKVFTTVTIPDDTITNITKVNYLEIPIVYTSADFVTIDAVSTLVVYLYITYDEGYTEVNHTVSYDGLVGIYNRTSAGTFTLGETSTISFADDLLGIEVNHS